MKILVTVVLLLSLLVTGGCGQSGALYLPDDKSTQQKKSQN